MISETKADALRDLYRRRAPATVAACVAGVSYSTARHWYKRFAAAGAERRSIPQPVRYDGPAWIGKS